MDLWTSEHSFSRVIGLDVFPNRALYIRPLFRSCLPAPLILVKYHHLPPWPPRQCQICLEPTMEVFCGSWRLSAIRSRMSAILETCQKVTERLLKVCPPEEGSVVSKHIDPFLWLWSPFDDSATTLMFWCTFRALLMQRKVFQFFIRYLGEQLQHMHIFILCISV